MNVTANSLDDFMAFTYVFRQCRRNHDDFFVYEVNAGLPTDYNLVMTAMKSEGGTLTGEPVELVVAKEWVLENLHEILAKIDKILRDTPETENND